MIFSLAILMGCGALFAQNSFRITVGGSMPIGNFGKAKVINNAVDKWALLTNDKSGYGGAGMGFSVGLQEKIGFPSVEGLGVILSIDGFYNGLNSELNDVYEETAESLEHDEDIKDVSLKTQKHLNFAPMAGVNYEYNLNESFGIFAEVGLGANMRKITNLSLEIDGTDGLSYYGKDKYDIKFSFAYKIGLGVIVGNRFVIGIHYFGLGTSKVTGKSEMNGYEEGDYGNWNETIEKSKIKAGKVNPMLLTLSVGVQF